MKHKKAALLAIGGQIVVLAPWRSFPTLQTHGFRAVRDPHRSRSANRLGFVLDPLAAAMLISLVSLCIFVF